MNQPKSPSLNKDTPITLKQMILRFSMLAPETRKNIAKLSSLYLARVHSLLPCDIIAKSCCKSLEMLLNSPSPSWKSPRVTGWTRTQKFNLVHGGPSCCHSFGGAPPPHALAIDSSSPRLLLAPLGAAQLVCRPVRVLAVCEAGRRVISSRRTCPPNLEVSN